MKFAFYPQRLLNCQKLHYLGLELAPPDEADIIFNWNWTGTEWGPIDFKDKRVINRDTLCTRKGYVDEVFEKIYGYSSRATEAIAVEKPEHTNGFKDARLTTDRRAGCFYQIPFMDLDYPYWKIKEYRIVIMDYRPVITLLKHKTVSIDNLIGTVDAYTFEVGTDNKIEQFCRAFPLEYGEIDGTYWDGRWYIYDVNPTPGDAAYAKMPKEMSDIYKNIYKYHFWQWIG